MGPAAFSFLGNLDWTGGVATRLGNGIAHPAIKRQRCRLVVNPRGIGRQTRTAFYTLSTGLTGIECLRHVQKEGGTWSIAYQFKGLMATLADWQTLCSDQNEDLSAQTD